MKILITGDAGFTGSVVVRLAVAHGQWAVMRTSWVSSAHGPDFVKTMLQLNAERDRLTVVADQIGGPTPAADIVSVALTMIAAMRGQRRHPPLRGHSRHVVGGLRARTYGAGGHGGRGRERSIQRLSQYLL